MPSTPSQAIPYPVITDNNDVPVDIKAIADRLEVLLDIVDSDRADVAWGVLDHAYLASNFSTTTNSMADVTGLTITWTAVTGRLYRVSACSTNTSFGAGQHSITAITDNSNNIKSSHESNGYRQIANIDLLETGSGSITRKLRFDRETTSTVVVHKGTYIMVEDIGPT